MRVAIREQTNLDLFGSGDQDQLALATARGFASARSYEWRLGLPQSQSHDAILDRLALVPEPATLIAGAVLLIPFALSTWPILRRRRTS